MTQYFSKTVGEHNLTCSIGSALDLKELKIGDMVVLRNKKLAIIRDIQKTYTTDYLYLVRFYNYQGQRMRSVTYNKYGEVYAGQEDSKDIVDIVGHEMNTLLQMENNDPKHKVKHLASSKTQKIDFSQFKQFGEL